MPFSSSNTEQFPSSREKTGRKNTMVNDKELREEDGKISLAYFLLYHSQLAQLRYKSKDTPYYKKVQNSSSAIIGAGIVRAGISPLCKMGFVIIYTLAQFVTYRLVVIIIFPGSIGSFSKHKHSL